MIDSQLETNIENTLFDFFIFNFKYAQNLSKNNNYHLKYKYYLKKMINLEFNIKESNVFENFIKNKEKINTIYSIFKHFLNDTETYIFLLKYVNYIKKLNYNTFIIYFEQILNNYSINLFCKNKTLLYKLFQKLLFNINFTKHSIQVFNIFKKIINNKNSLLIFDEFVVSNINLIKNYIDVLENDDYNIDNLIIILIEICNFNQSNFENINTLLNYLNNNYKNYTKKYLESFFSKSIVLINNNKINCVDCFLENYILYIDNLIYYDNNHLNLLHKILKDDNLTINYYIKCKFLNIFSCYLIYLQNKNPIEPINFRNNINNIIELIPVFFNNLTEKSYFDLEEFYFTLNNISSIYNLTIFNSYNYRNFFSNKIKDIDYLNYFKKIIYYELKLIDEPLSENKKFTIKNLIFLDNLSCHYCKLLLCIHLQDYFIEKIILLLKDAVLNKNILFIDNIKNIMINISKNKKTYSLFLKNALYNGKYIEQFISLLKQKDNMKYSNIYFIKLLSEKINKHSKSFNYNISDSKFRDPITDSYIFNPIMVPKNIIMDKGVIYRILFEKEENPFTREKLSLKILKEYNNNINIKNKINEFIRQRDKLNNIKETFV